MTWFPGKPRKPTRTPLLDLLKQSETTHCGYCKKFIEPDKRKAAVEGYGMCYECWEDAIDY